MCAYRDKIMTARRKCGGEVRKRCMSSNVSWEWTHTHTHKHHKMRQVDKGRLWSKDTLGSYISLTSDTQTTQITEAVGSRSVPWLTGV